MRTVKIDRLNAERTGACSLRVELQFGLITRLRDIQGLTHLLAAELLGTISEDQDMSNFQGVIHVDPEVYERNGNMRSSITLEAMDDHDLERAEALVSVVHDVSELML